MFSLIWYACVCRVRRHIGRVHASRNLSVYSKILKKLRIAVRP